MRRQGGNGKQGTVRGFREGLGPGDGEGWVQGSTKTGQKVKEDVQQGQGKALRKNKPYPYEERNVFFC